MSFKKTLLITSIIAASFSGVVNAAVGDVASRGTIQFKGMFVDSTCTVEINNTNSSTGSVDLGIWMTSTFNQAGETTEAVPVELSLSGCPTDLGSARITFGGTNDSDNVDLYAVDGAKGVGIGISEDDTVDGKYYTPNEQAGTIDLKGKTSGSKTYYARYVTTADQVSTGTANADVTVTIQYNQ